MLHRRPDLTAWLALASVCFFWGTTYLGIRIAIESFPPAVLVCIRYLLSGIILLSIAVLRKDKLPAGRELAYTALFGLVTIGIGNGALAFAEQWVPSGLAAMFITTGPFWFLGIEALMPNGARIHGPILAGMFVGLAGTLLLVAPGAIASGFSGPALRAFLVLQFGAAAWSLGSILQRRYSTKAHPVISGGVQQLATGLFFIVPAFAVPHDPIHIATKSLFALAYLVVFGGIVGYSSYIYALEHLPVSIVAIYNYINPMVAVTLGFVFYKESFGVREIAAMLVIFIGVAIVKKFSAISSK